MDVYQVLLALGMKESIKTQEQIEVGLRFSCFSLALGIRMMISSQGELVMIATVSTARHHCNIQYNK